MSSNVSIIGAGAWGTAFAIHLARMGIETKLWVRESDVCNNIRENRRNNTFLPDIEIPDIVYPTTDLNEALCEAKIVFWAVPTQFLRDVVENANCHSNAIHIAMSKGIERDKWEFPYQILGSNLGTDELVVLSGPSFAEEVAKGLPTVIVSASENIKLARSVQKLVSNKNLRAYVNTDPLGVSLSGAYKNIIAIASGISEGLGLGHNTRSALITRGLSELTRLGKKLGADRNTFFGVAGVGDMVLTCTSNLSRNYSFGIRVGTGENPQDILSEMKQVAEGVFTTFGAIYFADEFDVDIPIAKSVHRIIWENSSPQNEVIRLMERPLKNEWA